MDARQEMKQRPKQQANVNRRQKSMKECSWEPGGKEDTMKEKRRRRVTEKRITEAGNDCEECHAMGADIDCMWCERVSMASK